MPAARSLALMYLVLGCAAGFGMGVDAATTQGVATAGGSSGGSRSGALTPDVAAHLPEARRIAHTTLIVDTHIDAPYRLKREWVNATRATQAGDFDWARARAGGLDAAFMSIYIPASVDAAGRGKAAANELIGYVSDLVARAPGKFALARNPADVMRNFERGLISLPLGMENGGPIRELDDVDYWRKRGIRYVTLTHSKSNHIADSSYDPERRWGGLSPFGAKLVPRLEDAGIMVDVSHLSDAAFRDVLNVARLPVIASHSSARHFVPGFERNMSDAMIRSLAAQGGVLQINFGSTFVSQQSRRWRERQQSAFERYLEASGKAADSEAAERWRDQYRQEHPFPYASLAEVLDHFDHVVELVGIDHVGIGSDYDGVGDTLPRGLKDVAAYPHLIAGLLARGYARAEIEQMLGGNLMRVWRTVTAHGRRSEGHARAMP